MMKSLIVALGMIATSVSAASKCGMKVETFSDSSCSTPKEILPLYRNGVGNMKIEFHKCWSTTGQNQPPYLKILMCDEKNFVALGHYADSNCMSHATPPVKGYAPGECQIEAADTWVKVTDVELTGNRYGIGYAEAWGIFLCQTVLFGVCDGY